MEGFEGEILAGGEKTFGAPDSPFDRAVVVREGDSAEGNTLYCRDPRTTQERVRQAEPFTVLGRRI